MVSVFVQDQLFRQCSFWSWCAASSLLGLISAALSSPVYTGNRAYLNVLFVHWIGECEHDALIRRGKHPSHSPYKSFSDRRNLIGVLKLQKEVQMFLTFLRMTAFQITEILSAVSITGHPLISWTTEVLSASSSQHIQGPCCYDTMHVFASSTTLAESLSNLGIPSKSWRFGKILKTLQQEKKKDLVNSFFYFKKAMLA